MSVYLDVTFVSQLSFGGNEESSSYGPAGHRDPTGCWYASACMVAYFFEAGPRLGVPSLYVPTLYGHGGHEPISVGAVATLARNEHLEPVDGAGADLTAETLEAIIRSSGPLWFGWLKTPAAGDSYGHASVVVGVGQDTVTYHDPEDAPNSVMSLNDFNARRYSAVLGDSSMLRRAGERAAIRGRVTPRIVAAL